MYLFTPNLPTKIITKAFKICTPYNCNAVFFDFIILENNIFQRNIS
jgi:hypothetical protein